MATYVKNCWLILNDLAERRASGSLSLNIEFFIGIVGAQIQTKMLELFFGIKWITKRYILLFILPHQRLWIEESHVKWFLLYHVLLNEWRIMLSWASFMWKLAQFLGSHFKRRAHYISNILILAATHALTSLFDFMVLRFIIFLIIRAIFLIYLHILRLGLAAVLMIVF